MNNNLKLYSLYYFKGAIVELVEVSNGLAYYSHNFKTLTVDAEYFEDNAIEQEG